VVFLAAWFIVGAAIGVLTARRRGGRKLDAVHYGAIFGILFTLIGLFVDIYLGHVL
jgi:hypothetical protein